ncbi:nicotinamide riboside transporter PnuC [Limnohabitans sp.]|uniref:nicotinamide riboside transporter PnuC n=1 Tax=Limnohabitans sp. TaxID=1907725 RepID=UPI003A4C7BAD
MMSPLEIAGFVLGLAMVVCNIQQWHWGWPLAIASSVLYFFVFKDSLLYGEAGLQLVFVAISLWGWWQWLRRTDEDQPAVAVQRLSVRGWILVLVCSAALWPALALLLQRFTDSDVAWWDALPTGLSLVGQVLLGRKYLENWLVWVVVNAISVALFAHKGLWLTCVLYAVFTAMSLWGWRSWRQNLALKAG